MVTSTSLSSAWPVRLERSTATAATSKTLRASRSSTSARADVETHVLGAMRVINAALPLLRRSSSPRIVNVSSNMASLTLRTGPVMCAYASSKTMLNAMTVQYARRFAETDPRIMVNAVCPGYVATDFTGFSGTSTPSEGAAIAVRFATLPDGGPTGGFHDDGGVVPW